MVAMSRKCQAAGPRGVRPGEGESESHIPADHSRLRLQEPGTQTTTQPPTAGQLQGCHNEDKVLMKNRMRGIKAWSRNLKRARDWERENVNDFAWVLGILWWRPKWKIHTGANKEARQCVAFVGYCQKTWSDNTKPWKLSTHCSTQFLYDRHPRHHIAQ